MSESTRHEVSEEFITDQWQGDSMTALAAFQSIFSQATVTGGHIDLLNGAIDLTRTFGKDPNVRALAVSHEYTESEGMTEGGAFIERPMATKYVIYAQDVSELTHNGIGLERMIPIGVAEKTYDRSVEVAIATELRYREMQAEDGEGLEGISDIELARKAVRERIVQLKARKAELVLARSQDMPNQPKRVTTDSLHTTQRMRELLLEASHRQARQNAQVIVAREEES